MKKGIVLFSFLAMAAAGNYYAFSQTKKPAPKSSTSAADIQEGKNLISKSDCLACHQLQVKVVGPAYSTVAEKYPSTEANITKLADKIIKGGAGVWGQIPMNPHPSIAAADAKKMAKYVLSVKKDTK